MNRELPADFDSELSLVASALFPEATDQVLAIAAERGLTPAHFLDGRCRLLWEILVSFRQMEPARPVTFETILTGVREREMGDVVRPHDWHEITGRVPSAAYTSHFLEAVLKAWQRRSVILACQDTEAKAWQGAKVSEETVPMIEGLQAELANISAAGTAASAFTGIKELLIEAYTELEARYKQRGRFSGITTGIADLDRMTDGWQPEQLILIPGRPSMGKSALGFQCGLHAARKNSYASNTSEFARSRIAVGGFSVEMSKLLMGQRLLAQLSGISVKAFATGFMSKQDLQRAQARLAEELEGMEGITFEIDDTSGISIQQLEARARWLVVKKKCKLIIVDYAQLLTSNSKRAERSRLEEVSEVSLGLKRIARILKVPLIVCVQLNRDPDDRPGHIPMLSDMRECGQLEQDADIVVCPVRPEYYAKSDEARDKALKKYKLHEIPLTQGPAANYLGVHWKEAEHLDEAGQRLMLLEAYTELHVIKHRGGPTGMVKAWFHKERCWFEGWTLKAFSNNADERQENLAANHGEEGQ